MKKSSLTTAVLAGLAGVVGFAGSAGAVNVNPDGTGQVLIYPYYTVEANQQTLISVVNSTDVSKAVKVRFLEGYNSREVLDFNLFLSPFDVWTAAIGDAGTGAGMITSDISCTVPAIPASGVPFSNLAYTGTASDGGPTGLERTREGYVELISMADVVPDSATDADITHGPTQDCAASTLRTDSTDYVAPTGGLFGGGGIVNVANGTYFTYNADAIDGFTANKLWSYSGSTSPSLTDANTGPGVATAYVFQSGTGTVVTASYNAPNTVDAVSAVFMADAVMNEWVADAGAGIGTDWVVTFPTKRFYVNGTAADLPPFHQVFSSVNPGQSCDEINLDHDMDNGVWDREEGYAEAPQDDVFSPPPPDQPASSLCHEVNVISISDPADPVSVLGSQHALNVAPYGTSGWMKLGLGSGLLPASNEGVTFRGLPATGFAAQVYRSGSGGAVASYAGAFHHRVERDISTVTLP